MLLYSEVDLNVTFPETMLGNCFITEALYVCVQPCR